MELKLILLMMLWLGIKTSNKEAPKPEIEANYRCAKYQIPIDRSRVLQMFNQVGPSNILTHTYIIEYGNDEVMRISDPGNSIETIPVLIGKWDYEKGISVSQFFLKNVKKYYDKVDSLSFSIEDSKGDVEYLCYTGESKSICDSVMYTREISGEKYLLHFKDSLPNMREYSVFYPDIKWLPAKIIPQFTGRSTWTLDEVFYGKQAIDSILSVFKFADFERISEQEMYQAQQDFPIEKVESLIEELKD